MTAEEAKQYGLIDEVLELEDPSKNKKKTADSTPSASPPDKDIRGRASSPQADKK
jgi:ClpP class serine protease